MQAKINGGYVTTTPSVKTGGVYKPVTNTYVKIGGVYKPVNSLQECFAYNFDGIDDRGVLQTPYTLNDGGQIACKFKINALPLAPGSAPSLFGVLAVNQFHSRALINPDGSLVVRPTTTVSSLTELLAPAGSIQSNVFYNFRLARTGDIYRLFINDILIDEKNNAGFTGMTAEVVGCASGIRFFNGLLFDFSFGDTLLPMADHNQSIQPSIPAGNNMTLVNTTSDRWEQIPCNLRVTP